MQAGRSLNESRAAYETLRRSSGGQAMTVQTGAFGPLTPSPMSAPVTLKRNYPFEHMTGREIRPKPSASTVAYGQPPTIEQAPKKKRGRPTKAEAAARAEASATTSEPSTARRAVSLGGSVPPPSAPPIEQARVETSPVEETRPVLPPVSRMEVSSLLTPSAPIPASQSSSSSGKRKRTRSTRSEPEGMPTAGASSFARNYGQSQEYESPYARMAPQQLPSDPTTFGPSTGSPRPLPPTSATASEPPRSL